MAGHIGLLEGGEAVSVARGDTLAYRVEYAGLG
jgi:hypothetical protein